MLDIVDINLGGVANDGTGDSPRVAGEKINGNFGEIVARFLQQDQSIAMQLAGQEEAIADLINSAMIDIAEAIAGLDGAAFQAALAAAVSAAAADAAANAAANAAATINGQIAALNAAAAALASSSADYLGLYRALLMRIGSARWPKTVDAAFSGHTSQYGRVESGIFTGRTFADLTDFARAATASYYNSAGTLASATSGVARLGYRYNSGTATWVIAGLIAEEVRTNFQLKSCDFADAYYTKTNLVVTANAATAPDGTMTADLVVENSAAAAFHELGRSSVASVDPAVKNTITLYLKRAAGMRYPQIQVAQNSNAEQWTFDLDNLTAQRTFGIAFGFTASVKSIGNGWYRIMLEGGQAAATGTFRWFFRIASDYAGTTTYNGDGASGFYLWGGQIEAGATATSFIPTDGSQATRAADVFSKALGGEFNPEGQTALFSFRRSGGLTGAAGRLWQWDDGTANNRVTVRFAGTQLLAEVVVGGAVQAAVNGPVIAADTEYRVGIGFAAGLLRLVVNGNSYADGAPASLPTGLTTRRIGTDASGTGQPNAFIMPYRPHPVLPQLDASEFALLLPATKLQEYTA